MHHEHRRTLSSSTLTGERVINREGEELGKVENFMIDMESGCISYAVLSYGGIMGMGDKLFAVPFNALRIDEDQKCFILDVSKESLKNAPGFDKDNWPDSSDTEMMSNINNFYRIKTTGRL